MDDPRRSLAACSAAFGGSAPGAAGRAQALVADAVTQAWQGNDDAALATLDRAVDVAPISDAFLNRALLKLRRGDDAGAVADLDRTVRRAPKDARGYYYRSEVLSRLGKTARAKADAARAAALDADSPR
ncbi:tetratricopeptide repeat protein [Sphingomonas floccifaciens]|uniref:tetratricopeptide repeat protein n=1 Tax=Sphingomonas floccifaciens TaxID=1844115 RepID=UPI0036D2187B